MWGRSVRRDVERKSSKIKLLVWAVSFGVLASAVGGFFIMGSPATLRMNRFDERRIGDLQSIQYQVVNFYQRKGSLPNNLNELKDTISGFNIPADPDGNTAYGYEKVSDLSFKICADFGLDSDILANSKRGMSRPVPVSSEMGFPLNENWQHKKGYFCFDRKIDKDLYPILKNGKKLQTI